MKQLILSIAVSFTGLVLYAQETIKFDKIIHDFGAIPEKGGAVTYTFEFTNTGAIPLVIHNVSTSCGCTTPGWSREPVPPGSRGFVKATYTPDAAISFDKSLTVMSTGTPANVVLRIRGKAIAHMPSTEEAFPFSYGALRLRDNILPMARIAQGAGKRDSTEVINTGSTTITLSFTGSPAPISVEAVPSLLKAGEKGFIRVTYNATGKQEWGNVSYPVSIRANGKALSGAQLTVTATIVADFSNLTPADYQKAPIASVERSAISFNELKKGTDYTGEFILTNTGKSELIIYKAESNNANIKIAAPASLQPGKKATVKILLNTKTETPGDKLYSATLITNAPNQSLLTLMLTGKID